MSTLSLRLSESLHKNARRVAQGDGISVNQLISTALAEKLAALEAEAYISQRAKRGDMKKFYDVLAKVPNIKPESFDRLSPANKTVQSNAVPPPVVPSSDDTA